MFKIVDAALSICFLISSPAILQALPPISVTRLEYAPNPIGVRSLSAEITLILSIVIPIASHAAMARTVSEPCPISASPIKSTAFDPSSIIFIIALE